MKGANRTLQNAGRTFSKNWQLLILLVPAVVYIFVFSYIPMYGVQIAFRDFSARKGILGSDWAGLKYFLKFINQPNFWTLIKNTLRLSMYSLATFPCAIIFALLLDEVRNEKLKKGVQMISYMPHFLSTVVIVSMLTIFFHVRTGIVNNVAEALGGTRQDFMSVPAYFPHLYVWSGVWANLGWSSIIYIAALSGVSAELVEAAKLDGAGRMAIIWHIKIPQILPTIVIQLILSCGNVLNVGFEKVFLMQNALNMSVSQTISTYVYEVGILGGQFSYSTAIGLFNNIVNILVILIVNKIANKLSGTGLW